ncbi:MAG: family 43 glycosylhydrolase [Prevotella sp.]|nr:family 43 glycosylhydrolase [Prevotella sp.]
MKALLQLLLLFASMNVAAQDLAKNYKDTGNGNPISASVFCADPTALVYDGRIYVYGSNDHQQYIANGKTGDNNYGAIKSIVVFSSDDMVNWTFHGTIDVGKICSSWGWRFANSWAPSVTWRQTADGTPEFFLYFSNSGGGVGVLKASSPTGPWTSPLSRPLIDGDSPGVKPCTWAFDPGVVIDQNGTGWLTFGGGDPNAQGNTLLPGNCRIVKLKERMTALDGAAVSLPAPYHFEASELNFFYGKYVYTYCTSWASRDDWNQYEKRGNQPSPSTCSMCYMVSDDPLNPDSWQYKGEYVANPGSFGFGWGNNHTHLEKFNGRYYVFYHSMVLEQDMNSSGGFRSIGVDEVSVSESTQQIGKLTMTKTGTNPIKYMNPYQWQQAETMSTSGGVEYEDYTNIKKASSSNLGNDASENLQVSMNAGDWTTIRKVDFGNVGAKSFTLRARGSGTLEIRLGRRGAKPVARLEFSSADFEDHTISLDAEKVKDVRQVYFVFTEAEGVQFDAWKFEENTTVGINAIENGTQTTIRKYDLSGRLVPTDASHQGIIIEQYVDEQGVKHQRKRVSN